MNFKNIQGLRAVAVVFVLAAHVVALFDKVGPASHSFAAVTALGNAGVDLFFVISGFIMVYVHWSNFGDPGITRTFIIKRIVRIVPLYWLVTLALALAFRIEPRLVHTWPQENLALSLLMVPMSREPLLFVGWTLVYEMYFYYVFAVLLRFTRRQAFAGLTIWAAIVALAQLWPGRERTPAGQQYLGTLVFEFLLGAAVGTLAKRGALGRAPAAVALGTLAFAGSIAYVVTAHVDYAYDWNLRFLFYGVPMALVVYGFVGLERRGLVMPPAMRRIGDASYSIYLWHTILFAAFGQLVVLALRYVAVPWPVLLLVPVVTVFVCFVLYDRIEVPLLRVSRNLARLTR